MSKQNDADAAFQNGMAEILDRLNQRLLEAVISPRDYFAAAALQGFLAAHADPNSDLPGARYAAERAYRYADAMLAARATGQEVQG